MARTAQFHEDFPPGTEELWDITAKALMLRDGGAVVLSKEELESAAGTECVMEMQRDGSLVFRCVITPKRQ